MATKQKIINDYEGNIIKQCFQDKEAFLKCIEKIPNESLFQSVEYKLFWQVFVMIYEEGEELHMSVIQDVLESTNNSGLIEDFKKIVGKKYPDEDKWEYHLSYLIEKLTKEMLLDIGIEIKKNIASMSSHEMLESINSKLIELNASEIKSVSFKHAFDKTIKNIKDIASGKIRSILYTKHQKIDDIISFGRNQIIMLAAQKKVGKTRFVVELIDALVNNNHGILNVQWNSFEMQSDEMIRTFISKKIRLTDKQLLSINHKLTQEDLLDIEAGYQYFSNYPIEFIDEATNIFKLCAKFERFAAKSGNKIPVCVIDNLGLIKPHQKNDTQNEDDIARMLKDLRDKTGGLIIVLHHMTKESEGKFNVKDLYRPKVTHIRGSSRLVDFANKVILLHRPEMYNDVVKHYVKEGKEALIQNLIEVNLALNRNGNTGIIDMIHELKYSNFKEK